MFYVIEIIRPGVNRLHVFATMGNCGMFISYAGESCLLINEWELDSYVTAYQVAEAYRLCIDEMEVQ